MILIWIVCARKAPAAPRHRSLSLQPKEDEESVALTLTVNDDIVRILIGLDSLLYDHTMATPNVAKTPFRSRKAMMQDPRYSGTPPVLGVVSRDSNDGSQDTPHPSPLVPPAPQLQPNTSRDGQEDEPSVAESVPSQLQMCPPSPYSPPPGSAWSENTEDQWPYNHTKRHFRHNNKSTPGSNAKETPELPSSDRQQQQQHYSADRSETARSHSFVPTFETNLAAGISYLAQQQEEQEPDTQTPAALQRPSRVPPPSAHRQFTSPRNDQASRDLFLLQEEHALLNAQYDENHSAWAAHCQTLTDKLAQQEDLMQQLKAALQEHKAEVLAVKKHLAASQSELQYKTGARADELDGLVTEKTLELEQLQSEYHYQAELVAELNEQLEQKSLALEQLREQATNQPMTTENTFAYEQLRVEHEALQTAKKKLEAEMTLAVKSAEELLDEKQGQVVELHEKHNQLQEELYATKQKLERYENDIVQQSKHIFQLEEALERARKEAQNDVMDVQKEALERGYDWKVEKQTLQEEIRKLQERLADKDQEAAKLLEDQRRQQTSQIRDLEVQVQYLTNTLAEYQGRHKELRSTVDQHLREKFVVAPTMQNASCQTESSEEPSEDEVPTRLQAAACESGSSPLTPSVRFVDTNASSSRSAGSIPFSALSHQTPSPHLSAHSMRSASTSSPPVSEPSVPPTPGEPVSPWIPTWQGRQIHVRADPPPSCSPASTRSLSPPAASHSTLVHFDSASRPTSSGLSHVKELGTGEDAVVHRAVVEETAATTEHATNTVLPASRRREQADQVRQSVGYSWYSAQFCLF